VKLISYILLCLCLSTSITLDAQCCVEGEFAIRDFNVTRINLEVAGAILDDLSNPDQGVCRVSVEFQHQFLGDIIIELQSPSGRVVPLIGPGGTNGSGFTDFTVWDVDFVPCAFPADPDDSFDPEWDNDQAWGILGNYSGAYYPFLSCLETFNSGPVNGTWQLIITDTRMFDLGQVFKFRIEFCNGEGLTCEQCFECNAQASELRDSSYAYCSTDPRSSFRPVIADSSASDPEEFREALLVVQSDTLVRLAESDSITLDLAVGDYLVCSYDYAQVDSMFLPVIGDTIIPMVLEDSLSSGAAGYCADLGRRCVSLRIVAPPDTVFVRENLCLGDTLDIGGLLIDTAGTYIATIAGDLCDTVVALVVSEISVERDIDLLRSDTCARFTAFTTDDQGLDSLLWTLDDVLISRHTADTVIGNGVLCLTVYSGDCSSTTCDTIRFTSGSDIEILGDSILCPRDSVLLRASPGYTDHLWSTSEREDSIWISLPGVVTLQARDVSGCISNAQVEIEQLVISDIEILGDSIVCSDATLILQIDDTLYDDIIWSPGGTSSPSITVDSGGDYTVSARDTQGCRVMGVDSVSEVTALDIDIERLLSVCAVDAERSRLDLRDAFIRGDTVGVFSDIDASGAIGTLPILDFETVSPGSYRFSFTTSIAEAPCGEIRDTFTVEVFDCSCPILRILDDTVSICPTGPSSLDLSALLLSDSLGIWQIIQAPSTSTASIIGDSMTYNTADAGLHLLTYTISPAMASCRDRDSLYVEIGSGIDLGLDPEPLIYCEGRDTLLRLGDLIAGGTFPDHWLYDGPQADISLVFDESNTELMVTNLIPGEHVFLAIASVDDICPADTLTVMIQILSGLRLDLSPDTSLSCATQQISLSSDALSVTIVWSSTDGRILGDSTGTSILIQGPGVYHASASLDGACSVQDSVVVGLEANLAQGSYTTSERLCPGASDGTIIIDTVVGGSGVVSRFLDQVQIFTDTISSLGPGDYIFSYIDELGCTASDTVVIGLSDPDKSIDISGDTVVLPGTITRYFIDVTGGRASDSIALLQDGTVIDSQLTEIELEILRATLLTAILVDRDGCVYRDDLQITLIDPEQFYIPNVFSPNGDGVNDLWTVYALPGYWQIESLQVFDRWGNLVHYATDSIPGDDTSAWDGSYKGTLAPSDVYIYQVQLLGEAGQQIVLSGDLTLVR